MIEVVQAFDRQVGFSNPLRTASAYRPKIFEPIGASSVYRTVLWLCCCCVPTRFSSSLAGTLNWFAATAAWVHPGQAGCVCGLI